MEAVLHESSTAADLMKLLTKFKCAKPEPHIKPELLFEILTKEVGATIYTLNSFRGNLNT